VNGCSAIALLAGFPNSSRPRGIGIVSMLDRGARAKKEREAFAMQEIYMGTGILSLGRTDGEAASA
jgi:hypothetical protein